LLEARRQNDELTPHPCFHEPLIGWNQRLQAIAAETPEHLHPYLAVFGELPLQLASLFLAVEFYGGPRDRVAAESAITVTEWLMAHTLIAAGDACNAEEQIRTAAAQEQMLHKIVELGPIGFPHLRRHFKRQNKTVHQPTLDALLAERRVRLNEHGELVAA
jgi:hypothetical protein